MSSLLRSPKEAEATKIGADAKAQQLLKDTVAPSFDTPLKSYFGVTQASTDDSLKAGARGPTLVEDNHFQEKISQFDHERIPERVVHAKGAGAHGYFVLHTAIPEYTKARLFNDTSTKTPMFVRFSTVAGSRGSADSVRDIRGFASRFYTEEGNLDIVGNNIPVSFPSCPDFSFFFSERVLTIRSLNVFFVQDAIKFLDLTHAVKPEPDTEIPQAQSAHDNAWDFFSLTPESMHTLICHVSDRGIPRSFRMMQGFGVHTFVLVNEAGKRSLVKFHWTPKLGVRSLVWDEALKLAGQDPDFHCRDLYDSIDAGSYPEWELGVQIVPEEREHALEFDLLDATKIIPEELVPVKYIGTLTLHRRPDEFFPEVEQIAFCPQHMIPGIEHSNDPLLQGRLFSYFDTQISRLGGPNFSGLPFNRPICPVLNNQRDGLQRRQITKGPNYFPNRFSDAPRPVAPEHGGYLPTAAPIEQHSAKLRAKGPKFAEHYNQATLYWNSMSATEQEHIVSAYSFELGKVDDPVVHQNSIEQINHIDNNLAARVAATLSLPAPQPVKANHGLRSNFLSMRSPHNTFTASGRKIGIYVLDDFNSLIVEKLKAEVTAIGSIPIIVGPRKGKVTSSTGAEFDTQFTFETCRSTHFDAIFFPGGGDPSRYNVGLAKNGRLVHAAREAYMHYKTVGASGCSVDWLKLVCDIGKSSPSTEELKEEVNLEGPGVVLAKEDVGAVASLFTEKFLEEVGKHRAWERDVSGIAA